MKSEILSLLRNADGYVSGEELSKKLGVSRTAIWKNINLLRDEGYVINSLTNRGYKLEKSPDVLDENIIADGLNVSSVGTKIKVMKSVDSTNEEVKRLANSGEESGLIVAAEEQTAGKGRLGRVWKSDNGGLYFTLLIRPELPPSAIASITLAAGYAVCLAIRDYTGCDAKIKWPNDVIIGNKKVCGILTEMAAQSDQIDYVAIGIGINVNHTEFPEEISQKATSLLIETGKKIDRNPFFKCVIQKLDEVISSFLFSFSLEDVQSFKSLCATLGRKVSVQRSGKTIEGTACDINADGELIIKDYTGKNICINSGEVTVQGIY
ncbi:MAG: biotin--[acetyl-CoA-carboxylase] ligase [Clostridia bacterium]|nr:biotin--[acetyl-CoA-carboxylase] ligase [Clostridia bacterium]